MLRGSVRGDSVPGRRAMEMDMSPRAPSALPDTRFLKGADDRAPVGLQALIEADVAHNGRIAPRDGGRPK